MLGFLFSLLNRVGETELRMLLSTMLFGDVGVQLLSTMLVRCSCTSGEVPKKLCCRGVNGQVPQERLWYASVAKQCPYSTCFVAATAVAPSIPGPGVLALAVLRGALVSSCIFSALQIVQLGLYPMAFGMGGFMSSSSAAATGPGVPAVAAVAGPGCCQWHDSTSPIEWLHNPGSPRTYFVRS